MSQAYTESVLNSSCDTRSENTKTDVDKISNYRNRKLKVGSSWNVLKCNNDNISSRSSTSTERSKEIQYARSNISENKSKKDFHTLKTENFSTSKLTGRSGAASVLYNNSIFIFGGYSRKCRLNDMYRYDIALNKWSKIPVSKNTPSARENNPAAHYNNMVYIYGGYHGNKKWLGDLHCFNLDTYKWSPVDINEKSKIHAPPNLFGSAIGVDEQNAVIYFFGGYDGIQLYNQIFAFSIKENKWIRVRQSGYIPSARSCANGHIINGYFYLFGGYDGKRSSNQLYQYHIKTGVWTKTTYNISELNEKAIKHVTEEELDDDEETDDYMSLSYASSNRTKLTKSKESLSCETYKAQTPCPRYFAASFVFNSCIYILGGYDGYSKRFSDFYKFDIYQKMWTEIDASNFSGRSSMNVHLFKNVVYCVAGYDGKKVLNDICALKLEHTYVEAPTLSSDFTIMVNNPKFADVVFMIQNKRAYACRAILSARCPYFVRLFCFYFDDKNIMHHKTPIMIDGVSYDTFVDILKYLYTDILSTDYTLETHIEILLCAIKFDIFRLVQLCEMAICNQVNRFNVFKITILSFRNNCQQLCRYCVDYLIDNRLLDDHNINQLVHEPKLLAELYKRSIHCGTA